MGNVWEAMKKHQAEQEQREKEAAAAPAPDSGKAPAPEPSDDSQAAAPAAPLSSAKYAQVLVTHHDRGGRLAEQYRALRTRLLAQVPGPCKLTLCYRCRTWMSRPSAIPALHSSSPVPQATISSPCRPAR